MANNSELHNASVEDADTSLIPTSSCGEDIFSSTLVDETVIAVATEDDVQQPFFPTNDEIADFYDKQQLATDTGDQFIMASEG